MTKDIILLAAGGTGGHLFPAEALAHMLKARGYAVHLATDKRAERFAGAFPADAIHTVPSATFASKNPIALARTALTLWRGTQAAKTLIRKLKPKAVIGFGGYPTVPPLIAATRLGVPTLIHEQNAVMGRANKALAATVTAIAGGFLPEGGRYGDKTVVTGNPVRPAVLDAASAQYLPIGEDGRFRLVVFGGSQGAQFFSSAVPTAFTLMDEDLRKRFTVTHQARPEDFERVTSCYGKLGVEADIAPFFTDMPERIAQSQLVICRSGASSVSELAVIGRPAILVPYPYALDHDQTANAAALAASGGAKVVAQSDLTPERLAEILNKVIADPKKLAGMASAAQHTGKPDAARLLADLVEAIAAGKSVAAFRREHS